MAISTGIDGNKQACFQVSVKRNQTLAVTYVVSGFQEENFEAKVQLMKQSNKKKS